MSLRGVQRQAAAHYGELGADLSSTLRPPRPIHRTADLPTTTRLLRNSRLFSLPKPLEAPSIAQPGGPKYTRNSNTATLPYPTHAAIITPPKGFSQGDWGLKRALPDRAFKTTTPVVRVKHVDTIDHITEFESAADHFFTLQKVQEMNIPITVPKGKDWAQVGGGFRSGGTKPPTSAFEESADPKDRPESSIGLETAGSKGSKGWGVDVSTPEEVRRWRYDSPWIAGMQPGEFEDYVKSTIKSKRSEFRSWLRTKLAEERAKDKQTQTPLNVDSGLGANGSSTLEKLNQIVKPSSVSAEDSIEESILNLRTNSRDLNMLIWEFLDLPGRFPREIRDASTYADDNVDVEQGPPVTHPSAGLSYLRPVRQLYNHPAMGPMQEPPPVQSRILQRAGIRGPSSPLVIGVGGIAVERTQNDIGGDAARSLESIKTYGGAKAWVHAQDAAIDSTGRIKLNISHAHLDSVDVWNPHEAKDKIERTQQKRSWGTKSLSETKQMPELDYKKIE